MKKSQLRAVAWDIVTFAKQLMEERIEKTLISTNFCRTTKKQQLENKKTHKWQKIDMFLLLMKVFFWLAALEVTVDVKIFWLVVSNIGLFSLLFGEWSNLTKNIWKINPIWLAHIFQIGLVKNHQQTFCLLGSWFVVFSKRASNQGVFGAARTGKLGRCQSDDYQRNPGRSQ